MPFSSHPEEAMIANSMQPLSGSTYLVRAFGCQMNFHDAERVRGMLETAGSLEVSEIEEADIVVFLTCCVREAADTRLYGQVQSMRNIPPREGSERRIVAVGGCIGQRDGDKLFDILGNVDIVFGTHTIHRLPDLLSAALAGEGHCIAIAETDEDGVCASDLPSKRDDAFHAWVPITYGCNNFCTYCIVPYTRGRERSREPESILNELRDLQNKGFKEVILLGQNVNSYLFKPADGGEPVDMAALLALVAEAAPEMRVRFTTSNPEDLSDEIIATMASHANICNHIHLPVQSGSNKILKLMNRKYTREWYLDRIAKIREAMPDCGISSDMFTGFHNETEEDFEETLSLMREVGFDSSFMFKYSERPGTFAAKHLPDNVSEEVKIDRLNRMIALQNELSLCSNRNDVGKTFEVLVEGYSKRSKDDMFGRTQQNKVIVFPAGDTKVGDRVMCVVEKATSATLIGHRV